MGESRRDHLERLLARYRRSQTDAARGRDRLGAEPAVKLLFAGQAEVYAEIVAEIDHLLGVAQTRDARAHIEAAAKHMAVGASRCRTAAEQWQGALTHPLHPVRAEREVLREQARLFQHAADNLASVVAGRRVIYTDGGALRTAADLREEQSS